MQGAHGDDDWSTPRRVATGSTALRTPPPAPGRPSGPARAGAPGSAGSTAHHSHAGTRNGGDIHSVGARTDRDLNTVRRAAAGFGASGPPRRPAGETLRDFVRRYGWRAYALPLLSVLTVVALTTTSNPSGQAPAASNAAQANPAPVPTAPVPTVSASTAPGATPPAARRPAGTAPAAAGSGTNAGLPPVAADRLPLKSDAPAGNGAVNGRVLKAGALPAGAAFTAAGDGTFRVLPGSSEPVGSGPLYRYSIDVENGVRGVDLAAYAHLVQSTLADPRSWSGHGVSLQRVDSGHIDFHVSLTSQMTVRKYCGYDVQAETSCYAPGGPDGVARVVLNDARWARGAPAYIGDLGEYRIYMINHEDGHALGHRHAHHCLPGGWAPVMMQQTYGLIDATTHTPCKANPWPYPPGVAGAPGAEQADTARNDELRLTERYGS